MKFWIAGVSLGLLLGVDLFLIIDHISKVAHAQDDPRNLIYSDGDFRVVRIQDGACTLYVAKVGGFNGIAIATGAGCK